VAWLLSGGRVAQNRQNQKIIEENTKKIMKISLSTNTTSAKYPV
jgi:hypothetical protein